MALITSRDQSPATISRARPRAARRKPRDQRTFACYILDLTMMARSGAGKIHHGRVRCNSYT
ncbi:MAG TPA: hypothetical protein PK706_18225, partial [Xanthobacteraceae bacterium]|nr:hypothetical protein [Xanthobacteraceae bacterium]